LAISLLSEESPDPEARNPVHGIWDALGLARSAIASSAMAVTGRRSRKGLAAVLAIAAGPAAAAASWFLLLRDVTELATIDEAVTRFRKGDGTVASPVSAGVYA
jgi:hypothetical protein